MMNIFFNSAATKGNLIEVLNEEIKQKIYLYILTPASPSDSIGPSLLNSSQMPIRDQRIVVVQATLITFNTF